MNTECPIEPCPGRIVVQRDSAETVTGAGIFLPDNTGKVKIKCGTVLAIGQHDEQREVDPNSYLDVGCRVTFSGFGGSEIKIDGSEYLILMFADLFARINSDAKIEEA